MLVCIYFHHLHFYPLLFFFFSLAFWLLNNLFVNNNTTEKSFFVCCFKYKKKMLFEEGIKVWHVQLGGLCLLAGLASIVERKAAMRGCNRAPLPAWFDRFLRVAFLGTLAGPTLYTIDTAVLGSTTTSIPWLSLLLALYLIPYSDLCEQRGGRTTLYARGLPLWGWFERRFNLRLVPQGKLEPGQRYIMGLHPHGILPFGGMVALGGKLFERAYPGVDFRVLAATFCYYIPIYRDILLFGGAIDAARYSAKAALADGRSLALVPGGATEALYAFDDHDVVYIKKRYGFIKLAVETGASLVPIFSFNENNTFGVLGVDNRLLATFKRKFQAIFGISLPLITNIIPRKTKITVLVGDPIAVVKKENPTRDEVKAVLDQYISALTKLYNENREEYNVPPTKPELEVM